jgi:hypothetical protein
MTTPSRDGPAQLRRSTPHIHIPKLVRRRPYSALSTGYSPTVLPSREAQRTAPEHVLACAPILLR